MTRAGTHTDTHTRRQTGTQRQTDRHESTLQSLEAPLKLLSLDPPATAGETLTQSRHAVVLQTLNQHSKTVPPILLTIIIIIIIIIRHPFIPK